MKRHLLWLTLGILLCLPANARERLSGWCEQGNATAFVGGLPSNTKFQGSFPACTITIFDSGTANLSSIFSDNAGTVLANPFTADANGHWFFYADSARYDVRFSDGGITTPFTLGDFLLQDGLEGTFLSQTFSATPVFDADLSDIISMTLTANVTSSSITGAVAGKTLTLALTQDTTGGWTFVWPTDAIRRTVGLNVEPNGVTVIRFFYDGTNWQEMASSAEVATFQDTNNVLKCDALTGADAGVKWQACHDKLPSTGGVMDGRGLVGATTAAATITISKPVHILMGSGTLTFSGTGRAFLFSGTADGSVLEGAGRIGSTITVSNTAANGVELATGADFVAVENLTLDGPASGTGIGILWQGSRPSFENIVVKEFGGDGIILDTSVAGNANLASFHQVRSELNGGDGFEFIGIDSNIVDCNGCDATNNSGWGFNIGSAWSEVGVIHTNGNTLGGVQVTGDSNIITFYAEGNQAIGLSLTAASSNNFIREIVNDGTATISNSGDRNLIHRVVGSATDSGHQLSNESDEQLNWRLDSGSSATQRTIIWLSTLGVDRWRIESDDTGPDYFVRDVATGNAIRTRHQVAGLSEFNADGTDSVRHNVRSGSGTGGTAFGDGVGAIVASVSSAGLGSFNGGATIGSGTNITKHLSAISALDFDSITAPNCAADLTITVTGAALSNTVSLGVPNASVAAGVQFTAWVSAADTVTVRACAFTGTPNPTNGTFRADVWQH